MTDSSGCIVVLYDCGVNRYILNKYLRMQGEYKFEYKYILNGTFSLNMVSVFG